MKKFLFLSLPLFLFSSDFSLESVSSNCLVQANQFYLKVNKTIAEYKAESSKTGVYYSLMKESLKECYALENVCSKQDLSLVLHDLNCSDIQKLSMKN